MNKQLKFGIIIVVLMLAIGFASVTTNLILNNNVKLGFNASNFDIYFSSATPEDNGTATIDSTTRQSITYSTKTLMNVGDEAYLDYVVTNASTQYDANCTVEFTIDNGADEYVTIEQTGFVENVYTTVAAKSDKNGRLKITLKKGSMEPLQIDFILKIIVEPVGREEEVVDEPEEPEDPATDENHILKMKVDNRSTTGHYDWLRIPGYDEETGTNLRQYVVLDVNIEYSNADIEVIEYDDDSNEPVANSNIVEYLGATNKKYSYKINLRTPTTYDLEESGWKRYVFKVILRSKTDSSKIYDYEWVSIAIEYDDDYQVDYHYGEQPWATWFMNDGREVFCRYEEYCYSFVTKIDNNKFHDMYDYEEFYLNDEWEYNVDVPGYDNSGTNKRSSVVLDIIPTYDYQTADLVEVSSTQYWNATVYSNSNKIESLGSSGNTYSFKINLPTDVTSDYVRYYFRVNLRDKTNPSKIYNYSDTIVLTVRYRDTTKKTDANGNKYEYYEGKEPWATWFA